MSKIRAYIQKDQQALLEILRRNTPQYFDSSEEADYKKYLAEEAEHYFVLEEGGKVIGGGGFNTGFDGGKTVRISWDLIHPDFQGKGVGKKLTLYRIEQIKKLPGVEKIVVRTTQLVYPFYQKMGFTLEKTEKDFWAKGFDLYQLEMMIK